MERRNMTRHVPVLLKETIEALAVKPAGRYVDGTLGRAGQRCKAAGADPLFGTSGAPERQRSAHSGEPSDDQRGVPPTVLNDNDSNSERNVGKSFI